MAARLLRKTGEAIKHSPGALRRAITGANRGKYQMALAQADDPFKVGLSFQVEYVGYETLPSTDDTGATNNTLCDQVVPRQYKQQSPPFKRLVVIVNDKRLTVFDPTEAATDDGKKKVVRIPLYRVAYCGSNSIYPKTFTFIERSRDSQTLTCHVLSCESVKKAQTMVRVVAKAFQNVYMEWQAQQKRERKKKRPDADSSQASAESQEDIAATEAEIEAADAAAKDLEKQDISEEEKDRRALHRTFTRRSRKAAKPDLLDTSMVAKAAEFDIEEVSEFVDPINLPDDQQDKAADVL